MGAGGWRDEGVESWGGAVEGSELPLTVARGDGEPAANTGKAEALNAEPEEFARDGGGVHSNGLVVMERLRSSGQSPALRSAMVWLRYQARGSCF